MRLAFPVYGLGCGDALAVERALLRVPGVVQVYVNPATEKAYIESGAEPPNQRLLIAAVNSVGFRTGEVAKA